MDKIWISELSIHGASRSSEKSKLFVVQGLLLLAAFGHQCTRSYIVANSICIAARSHGASSSCTLFEFFECILRA
jgi:hypothetical protein